MADTALMAPSAASPAPDAQLARAWSAALSTSGDDTTAGTGATAMNAESARTFLTAQSAALLTILFGDPFRPRQAAGVGRALVQADFVSANVLGRSLRVLILRLPELLARSATARAGTTATAGDLEQRIAEVTEALANGYVRALRDRTLAEQESIRRAELDAQRIVSEQLRHQATHDPLTGLPNRTAVLGRLAAALAADGAVGAAGAAGAAGSSARVGLCYLDLDGFKAINDAHGHEAGDELLVTVAGRIGAVARASGALAGRIGGDEFVVLAETSPGVAGMIALATAILAEVRRPVPLRIGRACVSACAGIVECAAGSPTAATMVADADAALYQAKSIGPDRWAVYDPPRRQAGLRPRPGAPAVVFLRRDLPLRPDGTREQPRTACPERGRARRTGAGAAEPSSLPPAPVTPGSPLAERVAEAS